MPHATTAASPDFFRTLLDNFSDGVYFVDPEQRIEELPAAAYIDALTGVANRAFTEITLRAKLEELERYGWPFGVLFLDVDGFKTVKDGHDVGDRVLATVARTPAGNARSFDLVGRWGGEEFLVVAVNVDEIKPRALAERFRLLVAGSAAPSGGGDIAVTVSVGATLARPGDDPAAVVKRADTVMYESKRSGGNRVTLAT